MKTSEVIRRGGDIIRRRGWCQGEYAKDGKHCTVGALRAAGVGWVEAELLLDRLVDDGDFGSTLRWNDRVCKSKKESAQLLDAGYVLALAEEGEDDLTDYEEL